MNMDIKQVNTIINRNDLKERLDGDVDLLHDLVEIFIDDSVNLINNIENAINAKDASAIGKTAHTLKGAVSNFSAQKAYEIALKIEKMGKAGEIAVNEEFESLKKEIDLTKKALEFLTSEKTF